MRRALFACALWGAVTFTGTAAAQDDVGASQEGICCGTECCLIGGMCLMRGDANPADDTLECDPSCSQTAWTPTTGCPDAGTGEDPPDDGGDDGCSVGPGGSAAPGAVLALLAGLGFVRRRR
ncbi:MAG TPA: MYXO-CTERM sorting domain-containing protein [Sandaracinaceae bacterium LLY-WYZ-13_1]|nr:MYXO-CTERM sorting domain-containing protein [Sandaracinaceae bacterium LLY-WYZ-13_1]